MYDDNEEPPDDKQKAALAKQIEKTAKQQHLTGQRREAFTDSISLCSSCKWSSSRKRKHQNIRRMDCSVFVGPCPEDIEECSEYTEITRLSLNQMAEIAILLNVSGRKVGFHGDK